MMSYILMAWVCAVVVCIAVLSWQMVRAGTVDVGEAIVGWLVVAGGMLPLVAVVLSGRAG